MTAPNKKLVSTPIQDLVGDPKNLQPGKGIWNGEPGFPGRTSSPNAVPEKIREEASPFVKKG